MKKKLNYIISVYFGSPGSGKSTIAAAITRRMLKSNIPVYSNVPITGAFKIDARKDLGNFMIENGRVIIDEAGIDYNNRDFKSFSNVENYFWKYHRHYKLQIDVFSQSYEDFDKKIRLLAQKYYVVKRLGIIIICRRYQKKVGVSRDTGDFLDMYEPVSILAGGLSFYFAPLYWKYFNTYSRKDLPHKDFEKY